MPGRILIIRGGAIGDFILTLPAIGLVRSNLPDARIEVLGYPGISQLALAPHYADAAHSIEYGPLARFFSRSPDLDGGLVEFFAGFQQIISYLYDPDGIFEKNLRTAGVKNLLIGPGKLNDEIHAVHQLARPLESLAFFLEEAYPKIVPTDEDLKSARLILSQFAGPFVALHPGSGGKQKTWLIERWRQVISLCRDLGFPVLAVGGEADHESIASLRSQTDVQIVENLPLRTLAAVLSQCRLFLGHDSGISHLAAATGVPCLLLFGPTDPDIWGPLNPDVEILASPDGTMAGIDVASVSKRLRVLLAR